jgi:Cu(I)/Ag(I) efflux system periplasmic protein CusF
MFFYEVIMNRISRQFLVASTMLLGALMSWSGHAQSTNEQQHSQGSVQPAMTDGEVKKVDVENSKITIKHGYISHLDMPAMTMVLTVKDKAMLVNVKAGDKVRFLVVKEEGKLLVTDIRAGQ